MRTISQALSHPMVTVVEREKIPGIIRLQFGAIATIISLKIRKLNVARYVLDASHGIKTEQQQGPYFVRYRQYASPGEALDDFFSALKMFYTSAVRRGRVPSEKWLVPDRKVRVSRRKIFATPTSRAKSQAAKLSQKYTPTRAARKTRSRK